MPEFFDPYIVRIAQDWIAYHSAPESTRDQDDSLFNPFHVVQALVEYGNSTAWDFFLIVLELDRAGLSLSLVAAGPLEDFINQHGAGWLEAIEYHAKYNPRFASLLAGVWRQDTTAAVWDRVVSARGDAEPFR